MTVGLNQWAQFNCTVNCSCIETVSWHMVRRDRAPIQSNFSTACNSGRQTYSLKILATEPLNELALYCVAFESESSSCQSGCSSWIYYSRAALLMDMVMPQVTMNPQVTVTPQAMVTREVTVTPPVITVTTIQTQTITCAPNPTPAGCTGTV